MSKKSTESNKEFNDNDFEYSLRGVVLHNGNAFSGHYTSLIKC